MFWPWDLLIDQWLYKNLRRYEVIAVKVLIAALGSRSSALYTEEKKVYLKNDGRVMVAGRRHPVFKYTKLISIIPCLTIIND